MTTWRTLTDFPPALVGVSIIRQSDGVNGDRRVRALEDESDMGECMHDCGIRRRRRGMASRADCGLADCWLLAGEGGRMISPVVLGPSLDVLEGTDIGDGRRFSKLNRLKLPPGVIGLKVGVRASRNFV